MLAMLIRRACLSLALVAAPLVGTVVGPAPAQAAPSLAAKTYYDEGVRLLKERRFEDAAKALRRAVSFSPDYTEAWVDLGNAELAQGSWDAAAKAFRGALLQQADLGIARYNLAYALRKAGRFPESAEAYRAYLQATPTDADAFWGLAEALKGGGDRAAAADAFERYAELESRPDRASWRDKARAEADALRGPSPATKAAALAAAPAAAASPAPAAPPVAPPPAPGATAVGSTETPPVPPPPPRATPAPTVAAGAATPPVPRAPPTMAAAPSPPVPDSVAALTAVPAAGPGAGPGTVAADGLAADRAAEADLSRELRPERGGAPAVTRSAAFETGLAALRRGDFAAALAPLNEASRASEADTLVHAALAGALLGTGDADGALAAYARARRGAPPEALAGLELGEAEAHRARGDTDAALAIYRRILGDALADAGVRAAARERLEAID